MEIIRIQGFQSPFWVCWIVFVFIALDRTLSMEKMERSSLLCGRNEEEDGRYKSHFRGGTDTGFPSKLLDVQAALTMEDCVLSGVAVL